MSVNPFRPRVADPLMSASRERTWRVELVDRNGASLGFVGEAEGSKSGVVGWSVNANANSQVGLSATMQVRGVLEVGGIEVDWSIHRFRIWEVLTGVGDWPLGVLTPTIPSPEHRWRETLWDVQLTGKLIDIQQDKLTSPWSASSTVPVTTHILSWLTDLGEFDRSVTPSTATLPASILWPSGTSKLTMLNELAGAIGYWSLDADPYGTIRSQPYIAPKDRTVSWRFNADQFSLLSPRWHEEWNLGEVPNVYLGRSQEIDGVVFEATAEDWDPNHPTSIPRRGGVRRVEVEEGVEVATEAALQAHVDRRLSEMVAPSQRMTVEHLSVPTVPIGGREGVWPGVVVEHTRPDHESRVVVEQMSWSSNSPMCQTTWRRV